MYPEFAAIAKEAKCFDYHHIKKKKKVSKKCYKNSVALQVHMVLQTKIQSLNTFLRCGVFSNTSEGLRSLTLHQAALFSLFFFVGILATCNYICSLVIASCE